MTSTQRTLLTTLVLMAGAVLAGPASASAQLACGDTITEDTTLTADLICDYGEGVTRPDYNPSTWFSLLVGADGVTVDLNGHFVGLENASDAPGIGIFGHSDVTIKNGRTSYVRLIDTTDSRLIGLESFGSVGLTRSDRNRIAHNSRLGTIGLSESDDNLIRDNTAAAEGGGVSLSRSDRNVVRRNTLCGGMGAPLRVWQGSDANLIKDNTVPDTLPGWGECASSYSGGIHVGEQTTGNRLIGNTVFGVRRSYEPDGPMPAGSGDGIYVASPATTLIRNTANFNDDHGIEAVAGVKSGVNYARGNGSPLQCLNVKCRLGPPPLAAVSWSARASSAIGPSR